MAFSSIPIGFTENIEYYPDYSNPDFNNIPIYPKTESYIETNQIHNNSDFLSQIMNLIQQIASENYQKGYNKGYQDALKGSVSTPQFADEYNYEQPKYDQNTTNYDDYNYDIPVKDYSKLCVDEYGNWQDPTIEISAGTTWKKDSVISSPISASGIIKNEYDSAIITIKGSDGVGLVHEVNVNSDGTIWKQFSQQKMFLDQSLYGDYSIEIMYENQCGMTTINYHR